MRTAQQTSPVTSKVEALVIGEVLLVQAKLSKKTQRPDGSFYPQKAYCEFAEIIANPDATLNLLAIANKGDDRFNSIPKARRAWSIFEAVQFEAMSGIKFDSLKEEFTLINLLTPTIEGHKIRLYVKETTDITEYQAVNMEKTAKQLVNRKTGEILYFYKDGKHIFSNVQAQIEGSSAAKHERINVKEGVETPGTGIFPFNHSFPETISLIAEAKEAFPA